MLAVGMVAAHLLALTVVLGVIKLGWASAVLALLILLNLVYVGWHIFRAEISALSVSTKGELTVQNRKGEWIATTVTDDSVVSAVFSIIFLKLPGCRFRQSIWLLPDMLDELQYRYFRVWLKWGQGHGQR